jgi:hypothetical protein
VEDDGRGDELSAMEHDGIPRRAWFDRRIPKEASAPRAVVRDRTLPYLGELGRRVLALREASRAMRRARFRRFGAHRQQDEVWCVGYAAALRWNEDDPAPQAFDDHANQLHESCMTTGAGGWCESRPSCPPGSRNSSGAPSSRARSSE